MSILPRTCSRSSTRAHAGQKGRNSYNGHIAKASIDMKSWASWQGPCTRKKWVPQPGSVSQLSQCQGLTQLWSPVGFNSEDSATAFVDEFLSCPALPSSRPCRWLLKPCPPTCISGLGFVSRKCNLTPYSKRTYSTNVGDTEVHQVEGRANKIWAQPNTIMSFAAKRITSIMKYLL